MLPRGAAKNEAPRRPRYFSARASRAARRRFEDAPRTFGQDWFVIPQGLRTPVRPHGTRQQPRLSCVPIVFDYILIQGCKSKKLCRAAPSKRRQIHAAARNARKLPRAMKTAPTRRKRKNPFSAARARTPKRAAARVKSGKPRKAAALLVKHTKLRTPSGAAVKRRRAAQADAPRAQRAKARSFYKLFAERGRRDQASRVRRRPRTLPIRAPRREKSGDRRWPPLSS